MTTPDTLTISVAQTFAGLAQNGLYPLIAATDAWTGGTTVTLDMTNLTPWQQHNFALVREGDALYLKVTRNGLTILVK